MARASEKKEKGTKKYTVKVTGNPDFCGVGAGGVQFANGTANIASDTMAGWFREHKGYEVTEVQERGMPNDSESRNVDGEERI